MSTIHIITGNNKIGKTANISLPPIISCEKHPCQKYCYAVKHYKQYPEVRNAWDSNLKLAQMDRKAYFTMIRRYLLKMIPQYFRWHVSGDILDQKYLDQMKRIASDFYFVSFLVFTKRYSLDFSDRPDNLTVILSTWPGIEIPNTALPLAFIETDERAFNSIKCKELCEGCRICWGLKNNNVTLKELKRGKNHAILCTDASRDN